MSNFIKDYINEYIELVNSTNSIADQLELLKDKLKKKNSSGSKIICQGNGGSSAIASHFTVDLSKNAKIRSINFNESDLITCFSNDFGYENWVKEALKIYADKDDLVILISSSGESPNILNACNFCIENNIELITFTGMDINNSIRSANKNGMNFYASSKAYNLIENIHQFWLLYIVDSIIGKSVYSAK